MTAIKNTLQNHIVETGDKPAREFYCENCEMKIAEFDTGRLIIFCCSEHKEKALEIPLEDILAAAVSDKKSLQILMKFCIENKDVKFL